MCHFVCGLVVIALVKFIFGLVANALVSYTLSDDFRDRVAFLSWF